MGTDINGYDLLSNVINGARISILIALKFLRLITLKIAQTFSGFSGSFIRIKALKTSTSVLIKNGKVDSNAMGSGKMKLRPVLI